MASCVITIKDEVHINISGILESHMDALYDIHKAHPPNYIWSPTYKMGSWDGYIRYVHRNGNTYYNLLHEILPSLLQWGYVPEIVDLRNKRRFVAPQITKDFFSHVITKAGTVWSFRDYQVEMVNKLMSNGGGVGIAATGAGKTGMVAALALAYEKADDLRSIIIVPDKNLTDQTKTEYGVFGLDVGEYSGTTKDLNHQHVVSTWQALQNAPQHIKTFDVVIVDECHGLRGDVITKLLTEHGKNIQYRFGVTGTLPKPTTDRLAVELAVGHVQYTISAHTLMKQGHLSTVDITVQVLSPDLSAELNEYKLANPTDAYIQGLTVARFKPIYLPEYTMEKKYLQTEQVRLGILSMEIRKLGNAEKGNILCLVDGIRFGKALQKLIPDSIFLQGSNSMAERKAVYERFKTENNLTVIATSQIASTGLDIPRIFHVVLIDIGKAFTKVIQSIGRGLRTSHDKNSVNVLDLCSDLKYSRRHMNTRTKYYKEAFYPFTIKTRKYIPGELK